MTSRNNYLCRICLSSSNDSQRIFSTNESVHETRDKSVHDLSEKIRLCGGIEVLENDGLPEHICIKCILEVNAAHELREQCQRADAKLRELYGKATKTGNALGYTSNTVKDQYCQTDKYFAVLTEEGDNHTFLCKDLVVCSNDSSLLDLKSTVPIQDESNDNLKTDNEILPDTDNKFDRSIQELSVVKREAYRTRRLTMFKRVTSMENLRNYKERQRQYIKKNGNTKHDAVEKDGPINSESACNKVARVSVTDSELNLECPRCNRCYSSKKSLERHILTHNEKEFKCEKCEKQFFHVDKLLQHGKLHGSSQKSNLVPCKICNKSFRKTDTMVRHLNVHKRVNPKEVFSILKEIRDRRKLENNVQSLEINNRSVVSVQDQKNIEDQKAFDIDANDSIKKLTKQMSDAEEKIDNFYTSGSDSNSDNKSDSFDKSVPLYRCEQCTKCYSAERSLQRHLLIHDEKRFVCNVCNMKFFRQDRLKSHRERYGHDEDKDCSIPQKPPDDKSAIKLINSWIREELDSDNEGKGFPCEICGNACASTPVIAPIVSTLPQSHLNNIGGTLSSQANKTYMDSVQRMNAHAAAAAAAAVVGTSSLHVHPSPDHIPDVASAVRNIAIIGQVFYS
ncbi:oocyte zinc finger protein XlCOF6-like isoform X3 [Vespula squamosa]|uniref:Oocyte zinc finger protein XlCOF6-like isoform X3 n=1 Tax=Vespula squamosa TaxID=30214 RepID=A0ABD2A8D7_VESSQ